MICAPAPTRITKALLVSFVLVYLGFSFSKTRGRDFFCLPTSACLHHLLRVMGVRSCRTMPPTGLSPNVSGRQKSVYCVCNFIWLHPALLFLRQNEMEGFPWQLLLEHVRAQKMNQVFVILLYITAL